MLVLGVATLLTGCVGVPSDTGATPHTSDADGVAQSEALLERLLSPDNPGCSVAVAIRGELAWASARGLSDVSSGQSLSETSVFDFASVSKQFTATAILLLNEEGALSLSDAVNAWLPDMPAWAASVTLNDLLHHRSGIPDYTSLLTAEGIKVSDRATQEDALRVIRGTTELRDEAGTVFDYSNSNYVLLAEIAEAATGTPLPDLLASRVFGGHDLRLEPAYRGTVTSYERGQPTSSNWLQVGDGSVSGTPSALALWADYYRTGMIDGVDLADRATSDAAPTGAPDGSSYGAGILVGPDRTLSHIGVWAGSVTLFGVTADRSTVLVVSCNSLDAPAEPLAQGLRTVWE